MSRSIRSSSPSYRFFALLIAAVCFQAVAGAGIAQRRADGQTGAEAQPSFHEYRGVQLGMTAADVRKKLGDPRDKSDEQDFFVFNDTETAQVVYDKAQKVVTISADFMTPNTSIPSAKDVFGSELEAKPDGSMHKLVRFPKAGFWLSYSRTGGTDAVVTITLQKLP